LTAEQPPEPPPAVPVVVHTPVVTTEQRLMIDGTYKTFTTTDGVESPYINNTSYTIQYGATVTHYKCFASVLYSDSTTYLSTTTQPRTQLTDIKTIDNISKVQVKFTGLDGFDVVVIFNGESKSVFPYITSQTATEQYWSDGTYYYISTYEQRLMIDGTYKTITINGNTESPYVVETEYIMAYPKLAESQTQVSKYSLTFNMIYSDDTNHSKVLVKTQLDNITTISGFSKPQFKYTDLDGYDYYQIYNNVQKSIFPYVTEQTATQQYWSDGRNFTI